MTYTNTTTLQALGGVRSSAPTTAADRAFAQTQSANQALAEQVGNFQLFGPNGLVGGARSYQPANEIRNIVVYLMASVISAVGANSAIWNTSMIDWTGRLAAKDRRTD
jgi:hypothetical protein